MSFNASTKESKNLGGGEMVYGHDTAMIFLSDFRNNLKNVFLTFFEILDTGNTIFRFEKKICKSGFCVNPVYCVLGT